MGSHLSDAVADALEQVGLADTVSTVDEQGIEGTLFLADDGLSRTVGQFVRGTDDKGIQRQLQAIDGLLDDGSLRPRCTSGSAGLGLCRNLDGPAPAIGG